MQNLNFRLNVDGLEDRTVPAVTPLMVNTALVHQAVVADELRGVQEHLNDAKTTQTISFLGTHLRERADSSQVAFNILAEFLSNIQTEIAANPSRAAELNPLAGTIAMAEYQASINAAYAELYALGYGAPPRVPPPPPPSIDNGVNFGNTSNLPFSLTDPNFRSIGNGVRVWDVSTGTGASLALGNQFTASYTGYLTDGTVFDSGTLTDQTLSTTGLIPGFANGLVGMQTSGVRRIDIPADQGYGATARPGIPANSELVFEVMLISIQ